jgi:hypothetical protein
MDTPRRRTRLLLGALVLVVAAAGGGWLAGKRVKSPAEAAAARKAPAASLITVPVEEKVLASTVTARGTIRYEQPTPVALAGAVGGDGSAGGATQVTRAPTKGAEMKDGDVVVEVSGRPVLAFKGELPMYRSITPGLQGRDVKQVEEALSRIGIDPGPIDGTYDAATARAIEMLYVNAGYPAQGPSKEQRDQARTLRKAATDADESARASQRRYDEAAKGVTGASLLELKNAVKDAERGVDLAKTEGERSIAAAQADVGAKKQEVAAARSSKAQADEALASAKSSGTDPSNPPAPCTPLCVSRLQAASVAADSSIGAANAALDLANISVTAAQQTVDRGSAQADGALELANQRLADAQNPPDLSSVRRDRDAAVATSTTANQDAATFEKTIGIMVPAGEIAFFPSLPVRIDDVKVKAGDSISGQYMTVSGSKLRVEAAVPVVDIDNVKKGGAVEIRVNDLNKKLSGVISEIADKPGTKGVDARSVAVTVTPDDLTQAAELNGASVVVVIAVESTGGKAVLAVPVAALVTKADGSTTVQVAKGTGTDTDSVAVKVGLSANGFAQIEPIGGAKLVKGDRVVIGTK